LLRNAYGDITGQTDPSGHITHYAHDPFGRRIAKWRETGSSSNGKPPPEGITHYTWDGNRLLAEYTDTKAKEIHHKLYLYEPESFVPLAQVESTWEKDPGALTQPPHDPALEQMLQEARNNPQIWHGHFLPLQKKLRDQMGKAEEAPPSKTPLSSRTLYYHTDHLGTPRELTNHDGDIVWATTYRAWGATQHIDYPAILRVVQDGNTVREEWVQQYRHERPVQNLRFQGTLMKKRGCITTGSGIMTRK